MLVYPSVSDQPNPVAMDKTDRDEIAELLRILKHALETLDRVESCLAARQFQSEASTPERDDDRVANQVSVAITKAGTVPTGSEL